jgi:hypothetical protein
MKVQQTTTHCQAPPLPSRALEILGGAVDQVIPYYFPGEMS